MAYGMFRLGERVEDRRLMFPRRSDRLALPWLPLPRARPAAPSAKVSERTSWGHRTPRAASSGVPCSHRCRPARHLPPSGAPCCRSAGAPAVEWRTDVNAYLCGMLRQRRSAPSVMRQVDVDHGSPSVIVLRTTLISPSSSAWDCGARPHPRSSRMAAACTRVASLSPLRMMAARERTASSV